jgi:hypothetical protein
MQETAIFIMFVSNSIFKIYNPIRALINKHYETSMLYSLSSLRFNNSELLVTFKKTIKRTHENN